MQPHVAFDRVLKRFGEVDVIAEPFSLAVERNEFVVFLGPSGCGKTTLMRMAGGLDEPSGGVVTLAGEVIRRPDRRRGMVSQSYSSFPWLTVAENIAFGMRYRRDLTAAEKRARRDHYLALVGLTDFAGSYPAHISGGMRPACRHRQDAGRRFRGAADGRALRRARCPAAGKAASRPARPAFA